MTPRFNGGYYGKDDPEAIKQCLECTKPTCTNCLEWLTKADREELREKKRRGELDGE